MKSDKNPKRIDVKTYKDRISQLVGKNISLISNPNGHTEKQVEGVVQYASSYLFGVKVITEKGEYVLSFSYIDVYSNNVIIKDLFD